MFLYDFVWYDFLFFFLFNYSYSQSYIFKTLWLQVLYLIIFIKEMQENNIIEDNHKEIKYLIKENSVYCWKATSQQIHPVILHNRVELYYKKEIYCQFDIIKVVNVLRIILNKYHEEFRSDIIIPGYCNLHSAVFSKLDWSLSLSIIFLCDKTITELEFSIIINKEFDKLKDYIDKGGCNNK